MAAPSRTQPFTKEAVRAWLTQRWQHRPPLPSLEQIRREIGSESIGNSTVVIQTKSVKSTPPAAELRRRLI
jgi:hypothetical protein